MTLQTNLEDIIEQLRASKRELIEALSTKYDRTTNNVFNTDNKTLIELCEMTQNIRATAKKTAVVPTAPTNISQTDIYSTHINILNKIQYCNNLLRYTLRIYDIDFNNSNQLHDLIKYLYDVGSSITLTSDTDYVDTLNNGTFILTAQYEYDGEPIPDVAIGFFTTNGVLSGTSTTNSDGVAYFTGRKPGEYVAKLLNQTHSTLVSNVCIVYGMQYFMDGRVDSNRDLEVDLYAGYYNDIDLVNDIVLDNNRDIEFNIEMNEIEDNVVVDAYLDDNGDIVFTKFGDIPQYLSNVEITTDGVLLAFTSPSQYYNRASLINDIDIDSNGVLKINIDKNENEDDILISLDMTDEGALIYKEVSDK